MCDKALDEEAIYFSDIHFKNESSDEQSQSEQSEVTTSGISQSHDMSSLHGDDLVGAYITITVYFYNAY